MPLTDKGQKIRAAMHKQYGDKRGESVFYASINSGRIKGAEGRAEGGKIRSPLEGFSMILPDPNAVVGGGMAPVTGASMPRIKWDTKTVGGGRQPIDPKSTTVINVDPQALNRAYNKTDPEFAKNLMSGRMDRLKEHVDAGNPVSLPEVGAVGNRLGFVNGRHRAQLAADRREQSIPLAVDKGNEQSIMDIISKYGRAEGGRIPGLRANPGTVSPQKGRIKSSKWFAEGGSVPTPRRDPRKLGPDEEDEVSIRVYKPQGWENHGLRKGNPFQEDYSHPAFRPRLMPFRGGNDPGTGINDPKEVRLASGGSPPTAPWYERGAMRHMAGGMLRSAIPGRTDKLNLAVGSGSYVMPADTVSALGQGNSMAGAKIMDRLFKKGPTGANLALKGRGRAGRMFMADGGDVDIAEGGDNEPVDIIAAGGEYVLTPEQVAELGGGDVDIGHKILDDFVKAVRKEHVKTLRGLPSPKR